MEPRHVFPADRRRAGVSAGTPNLDRLRMRIQAQCPLGGDHPVRRNPRRRGDDDLNPGMIDPAGAFIDAAVLVALVARPAGLQVLLTRRTAHLSAHAGQCAFPGGRIEAWDASPESAALREAQEEVGLDPEGVEILGQLDTYLVRTGYRVTPIVALMTRPQELKPDGYEAEAVFEVPLDYLMRPESRRLASRTDLGQERFFYIFDYGDYDIWGATAGMLVNLIEVLGHEP
ncbi:NUDIX hydrolase [Rhodovibrio salinarum]|uniref:CoA pyrophosphatase n=1 Tax=Rhodovibrio salinarum TaxID=1087 RepID=A0A934UZC0_9PROT|nr:CoA pyrophosphatase [Rhodovibrio salinarum]MBK1696254.1 CoA pyrophosphatase [Rhodovibrio salinarum]